MAKNKSVSDPKNKIVLFVGCFEQKKKIELYNFKKVDHYWSENISYIRVLCGGRFYYFKTTETVISEIEIY